MKTLLVDLALLGFAYTIVFGTAILIVFMIMRFKKKDK